MRKFIAVLVFIFFCFSGFAQEKIDITEQDYVNSDVEMADDFRAEGKIYVLTGIILIILFGTIVYLISIDRRVARLEKQPGNNRD
ncbi:MAG: CcmD family protein [Bacteroidota bacterium]